MHSRRATPHDAGAIQALIDAYVPSGALLPRTEEFIASNAHSFVVVEDGGRVIGCAHLDEYSPSLGELRSLAVATGWQGKGVGRELIAAIERLARRRRYSVLFAVSNDEAFFVRHGYEPRHIPELDRERSEVSKFKGVYAKDLE